MTCNTDTCNATATHTVDNRGKVIVPTYTGPTHCLVHAAGAAAYRIIRPRLNVFPAGARIVDPGAHARSVGGHKSQRGF